MKNSSYMLGLARIALGLIFLWAFLDKVFGLGYATKAGKTWLDGVSPTAGFLKGAHGPFAGFFHGLAGSGLVDWLFMLGLLGIGLSLTLGIFTRLASYAGALLVILMWAAALPPAQHPFLDDHTVYFFVLLAFAQMDVGNYVGVGKWWSKTSLVKDYPILQ